MLSSIGDGNEEEGKRRCGSVAVVKNMGKENINRRKETKCVTIGKFKVL